MPSSLPFSGAAFSVQAVAAVVPGTVRIRYTQIPLQVSSSGPNDALNPANYVVSGPTPAYIGSIVPVGSDVNSVDIVFTAPLTGGLWTFTVSNVQTPGGTVLTAPKFGILEVDSTGGETNLVAGSEFDDAKKIIRKHFNPVFRGPNWDALIAGLASGDDRNWDNAQAAFDQLFRVTASGKYLDILAANDGLKRSEALGLDDDTWRQLLIASDEKVVIQAILRLLEVFYGRDSLRAFVETELSGPFALSDGQTLDLTLDGKKTVTVTFNTASFAIISAAKAEEVAAVITDTIRDYDGTGFATAHLDLETNVTRVRIYSGSLGLWSTVQVTGGTAQNALRFNDYVETYTGSVVTGDAYSWVYTEPTPGKTKISLSTTTNPPKVDLTLLRPGDYVIVSAPTAPGVYTIESVGYSWSGGTYTQYIQLTSDIGYTGSNTQASNDYYRFFRPTRQGIQAGDHTVVVSQRPDRTLDVVLPATSSEVNRDLESAAYLHGTTAIGVSSIVRLPSGQVTVTTATNHGLVTGDWVEIEGFKPATGLPYVSPPAAGNLGGGWIAALAATENPAISSFTRPIAVELGDGDVLIAGGYNAAVAAQAGATRFRPGASTTVSDNSQAHGAPKLAYSWVATASLPAARMDHAATALTGAYYTSALVTGGTVNGVAPMTATCYRYVSNSWTAVSSMNNARASHCQVLLSNGEVLVAGGRITDTTATATSERYNVYTGAWTPQGDMSVPRANFTLTKLDDGRVLAAGGTLMARSTPADTLAYWQFEEAAGPYADDIAALSLTVTGGPPTGVNAQVRRGLNFSTGGYLSRASTASLETAFLGDWTIDFWVGGWGAVDEMVLAYGAAGAGDNTQNTLVRIYNDNGNLGWGWDYGNDVSFDDVTGSTLNDAPHHIALVKNATLSEVRLYVDGVLFESWGPGTYATGGSASQFYVGFDPEGTRGNFSGILDDLKIWDRPLTAQEVGMVFLQGSGRDDGTHASTQGDVTDSVDIYDPVTGIWTPARPLGTARAFHQAVKLPNGHVVAMGGRGYTKSQPTLGTNSWPALQTTEIYDPVRDVWSYGPPMSATRAQPWMAVLSDKALVGDSDTAIPAEYLDFATVTFKSLPVRGRNSRSWGLGLTNGYALMGGGIGVAASYTNLDVWVPGSAMAVSGADVNGRHKIESYTSNTLVFAVPSGLYASSFGGVQSGGVEASGDPTVAYDVYTNGWNVVNNGVRTTGTTTLTCTAAHGLTVGDLVLVNLNNANFSNGVKTLTGVTATTLSYAEAGSFGSTALNGVVARNWIGDAVVYPSIVATTEEPGPYVYDPYAPSISSVWTTITSTLVTNTAYSLIDVTSTTGFPDEPGWFVLAFGESTQSQPIRYIEKVGATKLLVASMVPDRTWPIGTTVTLLEQREPVDPPVESYPAYLTGSHMARVEAERYVNNSAAAGIDLNLQVVYPGDRGLGKEGQENSDVAKIWGEDS
jgi:hypothetical protein